MRSLKQKLIATTTAVPLAIGLTSVSQLFDNGSAVFAQTVDAAGNPCAAEKVTGKPSQAAVNDLIICLWDGEDPDECIAQFTKNRGGSSSAKATCNPCATAKPASNPCTASKPSCNPCATAKAASNPCTATKSACNPSAVSDASSAESRGSFLNKDTPEAIRKKLIKYFSGEIKLEEIKY